MITPHGRVYGRAQAILLLETVRAPRPPSILVQDSTGSFETQGCASMIRRLHFYLGPKDSLTDVKGELFLQGQCTQRMEH